MELEQDLRTYAELGQALWVDPERAAPIAIETLSAVFLLDLTDERALDRASQAMLECAEDCSDAQTTLDGLNSGRFGDPFFKLTAAERFALVALHSGRWSYARIARVMKIDIPSVEALAWKARTRLVSGRGKGAGMGMIASLPKRLGPSCPEYDFERPWTQRFLDEEIANGREMIFIQNHVMACDICGHALNRCRDLYFTAEKLLPERGAAHENMVQGLFKARQLGAAFRSQGLGNVGSAFRSMLGDWELRLFFAICLCLFAYKLLSHRQ